MISLIRTLTLNPFIGAQLAALFQTLLLVMVIIFNKDYRFPKKDKTENMDAKVAPKFHTFVMKYLQLTGEAFLAIFGVLFLDISLFWLFGSWSYVDWRFQLPSVIITLFIGLQYYFVILFRKGNIADILFSIICPLALAFFLHWWVPAIPVMALRIEDGIAILIGSLFLLYIGFHIIQDLIFKLSKSKRRSERYFWDIRSQLNKIFNRKLTSIIWILACIQGMLLFNGYSLFSF